jgi:uncharacterized protein YndB with AHSA1/START domain
VFDAWTNPEVLRRWWAVHPAGTSPECDVDLRVGGGYTLRMSDPDTGDTRVLVGEYREVVRPHRLVYTWRWEAGPNPGHESLVTVEFVPTSAGITTVRLEHTGFASEESRAAHGIGWSGALDSLRNRIFPAPIPT